MFNEKSFRQWAARVARSEDYEVIPLPFGISGVARAGDSMVHDPDHLDERYRLSVVRPLALSLLPTIKEKVRQWEDEDEGVTS